MRSTRKPILVGSLTRKDLKPIIEALNSKHHFALKQMVTLYLESGPNLEKMFLKNEELGRNVSSALEVYYRPTSTGQANFAVSQELHFKTPSLDLTLYEPDPEHPGFYRFSAKGEDVVLFAQLTINPEWEYLGGPCARCQQYYTKKKLSQKVYCSRRCGNAATATARSAEKWHEEHEKKLRQAREIKRTWNKNSGVGWKEFVSEKTGFTVKWLTRNETQLKGKV